MHIFLTIQFCLHFLKDCTLNVNLSYIYLVFIGFRDVIQHLYYVNTTSINSLYTYKLKLIRIYLMYQVMFWFLFLPISKLLIVFFYFSEYYYYIPWSKVEHDTNVAVTILYILKVLMLNIIIIPKCCFGYIVTVRFVNSMLWK